ncbi:MAG: 2-C-methyl-D-erythritol 2,4-cyclodiphosphate synthase [Bacteroidetes bacterium]|nr:2-C-methyl-D-erythritol 2,4-cyclodiphosphate synthase [Bacteroidota bacterium]GDX48355.1 2-C-methyl-D-erythritol 2,4-cyclodiphosphate synthase [Bacteroidota bacterium]
MTTIRVGMGFDVHQLVVGRRFVLGGIEIPNEKGILGHSDADVLIHAICDALLGAANLRDIGYHFPNTSTTYKNADSKDLLKQVVHLVLEKGYSVVNIDATIVTEAPKINPHINAMQLVLSACLNIDKENISIKATTNERMGFIGREEGITAYAVALIEKTAP